MPRVRATFLYALLATLLLSPALGSLETAVLKGTARGKVILPSAAPLTSSVMIPLHRMGVRHSSGQADFYVGNISVGIPAKTLQVVFDTASGNVILPHRACKDVSCLEHRSYSPWESFTAMDVDQHGGAIQEGHRLSPGNKSRDGVTIGFSQSDLGEGDVKAVFVRDNVCIGAGGEHACVDMALLAATHMDEKPFRFMPSDGIVGLGLGGLTACPLCGFFGRLLEGSTRVPQIGLALGAERGELHFGGHDLAQLAAPLRWFPVDNPEAGLWQVAIQAVRVGNRVVDDCRRGCHGIVDSGVSRLGVQASKMQMLSSALASGLTPMEAGCGGPDLSFDLGGMTLTLHAQDYAGSECTPVLGALDLEEPEFVGVYAFGATLLRRYYAAFDWEQRKLAFAPLTGDVGVASMRSQTIPDAFAGTLMV